jgi:hypothetical protein
MVVSLKDNCDLVSVEELQQSESLFYRHVTRNTLSVVGIDEMGVREYEAVAIF